MATDDLAHFAGNLLPAIFAYSSRDLIDEGCRRAYHRDASPMSLSITPFKGGSIMQRPTTTATRFRVAMRPTIKDGYPQRIPLWEAVERLGSVDRGGLLLELRRSGYARPNGAIVDEAYCRTELTDMVKRGFLARADADPAKFDSRTVECAPDPLPVPERDHDEVQSAVATEHAITARQQGSSSSLPAIDAALDRLDQSILRRSGSVFYTGRSALSSPSRLYLLGLNPGGDPTSQALETVEADIGQFRAQPPRWSAYRDESWAGARPGTFGMQPRVLHMLARLGLAPEQVPASNVVFVRSRTEATLAADKAQLLRVCWDVHETVISSLGVDTIVCFGGTAGRWVREMSGADRPVDQYVEQNGRGWTSEAHASPDGMCVVTVTHPSRANWLNDLSDPTALVERVLHRRR